MRQPPVSVRSALRRYDSQANLGARFNPARRGWLLTRNGEDTSVTLPGNDLTVESTLERVRESDSQRAPSTTAFVQRLVEKIQRPRREKARDFHRYDHDMKHDIRQRLRRLSGKTLTVSFAGLDSPVLKSKPLNLSQRKVS